MKLKKEKPPGMGGFSHGTKRERNCLNLIYFRADVKDFFRVEGAYYD